MTQSNFIAAAIFVAFIVYITAKGRLGLYLGFLGFGSASASGTTGSSTSSVLGQAGQAAGVANQVVSLGNQLGNSAPVNIISNDVTSFGF